MELTWINKLRIAAVAALGVIVIGVLAWPLVAPEDPLLPVRAGTVTPFGTMTLLFLCFAVGIVGYFLAWPHGREIGILGVPFGLTIWAGRSGPMRVLTQIYDDAGERLALLHALRFEPVYWLLLVVAGLAGVLVAQYVRSPSTEAIGKDQANSRPNINTYVNGLIALAVSVLVSQFFVGVFAQNLGTSCRTPAAQPAIGQIIFAVAAAFGVAAFVVKKFLNLSYLWPMAACAFLIAFAEMVSYRAETVRRFAETLPATSFPHSIFAVVPIQLVALGALGSVIGYWLAVRYDFWRKHENPE
jgi:hypothetical protein